jgi:hypothetical protein
VPSLASRTPASGPAATTLLTVNGTRLYRPGTKSLVLVGDAAVGVREPGPGDVWAAPTDTSVQVPLPALDPGTYPVRVQSNGAQSIETLTFTVTP